MTRQVLIDNIFRVWGLLGVGLVCRVRPSGDTGRQRDAFSRQVHGHVWRWAQLLVRCVHETVHGHDQLRNAFGDLLVR